MYFLFIILTLNDIPIKYGNFSYILSQLATRFMLLTNFRSDSDG